MGESQLVDCVALPQWCKQSGVVFSKEVHMEGDSLGLPAAVALLRVWLNGSEAICSGPRYRDIANIGNVFLDLTLQAFHTDNKHFVV